MTLQEVFFNLLFLVVITLGWAMIVRWIVTYAIRKEFEKLHDPTPEGSTPTGDNRKLGRK